MKRIQVHICWKASFSWEKVGYAILRVKLAYIKDFSFSWNECYFNAETDFNVLELFCRASYVRASMHRNH